MMLGYQQLYFSNLYTNNASALSGEGRIHHHMSCPLWLIGQQVLELTAAPSATIVLFSRSQL